MKVIVILRAPDGRLWDIETDYNLQSYWEEGNCSCDCNRAIYVNDAHDTDYEVKCGDTWEIEEVIGEWSRRDW